MITRDTAPARDATSRTLGSLAVTAGGTGPAARCAEQLALLGAGTVVSGEDTLSLSGGDHQVTCAFDWGPAAPGAETVVQALTGLMAAHGRGSRTPRRLGVDVASFVAGTVAAQGVLAALLGQRRGLPTTAVHVSVPGSALLLLNHQVAIATSGGEFPYHPSDSPGPPFRSADGHWVEIEVLSGDDWAAFWRRLGIDGADVVGRAWLPFVYRYLAGRCGLPAALHQATARHTLAELRRVALACDVALSPVREPSGPRLSLWTLSPHPDAGATAGARPASAGMPLQGLRVVEVTSRQQGPLAGALLLLLGAEVVKVEPPGGDFGRGSPPLAGEVGAAYLAYNRGKHVVEVDYKRASGRAELADLAAGADVFLHNWRPGRAESLGLDAADLAHRNPALVYAFASGWGAAPDPPSPIAGDFLVQAYAGCGAVLNPPEDQPFPSPVTLVDATGGLLACTGVLAGLYLRERIGRGCRVDTSLLAGAQALCAAASNRWGPLDRPIRTADGYLVVSVADPASRRRLRAVCGEPVTDRLRERPAAQWERVLRAAGVPAAVVREGLADLPADRYLGGLLDRTGGGCAVPGAPWRFS